MDAQGYMKWLSILCLVMALFGTAVMLVGYKAPTIGLVATVAALVIAAAALAWKARERSRCRSDAGSAKPSHPAENPTPDPPTYRRGAMGTDFHRPLSHAWVL